MSEYLSGEELWDKYDAAWRQAFGISNNTQRWSSLIPKSQQAWNALAAELKVPRPKVPTLAEVYHEWQKTVGWNDENGDLEQLRQRLNAAHEARREATP